jgi:hypothetical protein
MLSQEEVFATLENVSVEKITREYVPSEQLISRLESARGSFKYDLSDIQQAMKVMSLEYAHGKVVRGDNVPENAEELGYLSAPNLYPDFIPRTFDAFARGVSGPAGREDF